MTTNRTAEVCTIKTQEIRWGFHVKEQQEILDISLSVTNKVTMGTLKHKVEEHLHDKGVNLGVVLVFREETLDL